MKILYYDCFAGISGDMHLGAMIDAGVDPQHLKEELKKLPVQGIRLEISRDKKNSIEGTRVKVVDENSQHEHVHRSLHDIESIIASSALDESTQNRALYMFKLIAKAEAKIHGTSIENVHFHEVGAIDSIADITGAAICLEYLNPDKIISSPVELGSGMVRCAHGLIPVPAPATSEILKDIPVKMGNTNHEATTPTGAAILAANVDEFSDKIHFNPIKIGYGIGARDADLPNILRVFLAEVSEKYKTDGEAMMLETNIDDMSPEDYGYLMDLLFDHGAYDVFTSPVTMKKSRPATKISVLCSKSNQQMMAEILFRHSTTLGIRSTSVSKLMMAREIEEFTTSLGQVKIKKALYNGELIKWKPEFEDCKSLARKHQLSIQQVRKIIESEYNQTKSSDYETHN